MFAVGICGTLAMAIMSGTFNIGIGYFLVKTGLKYKDEPCKHPIAEALILYGYVMWTQWLMTMLTLVVTWNPICMRFFPRAWVPSFLKRSAHEER